MTGTFKPEWEISAILKAATGISERKRSDYAGVDPDDNFISSAQFAADICKGLSETDPRRSTAVLIGVKLARLRNLGLTGGPKNEPIGDTLDDTINYVAILRRQTLRAHDGKLPGQAD